MKPSLTVTVLFAFFGLGSPAQAQQVPATASPEVSRIIGTIKSVQPDVITVSADSGDQVSAKLSSSTRVLRIPPGDKDLKNAVPLQVQDLQPGDRVLVRGRNSENHSIAALSVIVMKHGDVASKQAQDREDWQKRGIGGLVTAINSNTGDITISSGGLVGKKNVVIHTSKNTISRRYAAGSVKFDDARPAPIDQIKPGDQLRARGTRSSDGSELVAEELVSGTFRNIAGTIATIDAAGNSISVEDAIGKHRVTVKLGPDSQVKKLPAEFARRIALRLRAASGESSAPKAGESLSMDQRARATTDSPHQSEPGPQRQSANGSPDFQRFLSRLPNVAPTELQKGDAVMIVATQGTNSGEATAITLLGGVEPILTAAPQGGQDMTLSPWSLGGGGDAGGGQ